MQLVQYLKSTGQIQGTYESNTQALLEVQIMADDPTYGYLLVDTPIALNEQMQYEIVGGQVQGKAQIQIVAEPRTFPAQGGQTCTVTVEPFMPCTLTSRLGEIVLTAQQPTHTFNPKDPAEVVLRLARMPGYWADPVTLIAT